MKNIIKPFLILIGIAAFSTILWIPTKLMNNYTKSKIPQEVEANVVVFSCNDQTDIRAVTEPERVAGRITSDFEGAKVSEEDLEEGCLGPDCITSLDDPLCETAESASTWLQDEDRVFGIDLNGSQRAYPQKVLNWHEIANDTFDETPVAVTFCPLCGTAVSFIRDVNGYTVDFGVSGKLYNSDLVMYDRYEGSLWQQATGEAIAGKAAQRNEVLEKIPTTTTTWGRWKKRHPETIVLSRTTGYDRDYDRYPYGTYERNGEIYFGIQNEDLRLPLKEVVYGVVINGEAKAYQEGALEMSVTITDTVGGQQITVMRTEAGEVTFTNNVTFEEYIPLRSFWFAWAAFNPDTGIYVER